MGLLRRLLSGLAAWVRGAREDADLADEVGHYLAEAEADLVARGASRREARRYVHRRYGDGLALREEVRALDWETPFVTWVSDVRAAALRLARAPRFTALAITLSGLGIGAATSIFSVARPVLLAPLPYPDGRRLVAVRDRVPDGDAIPVTFGTYREVLQRSRAFGGLAVMRRWTPTATGSGEPERLEGQRVSADYFRVLGVTPVLGAGFRAGDDHPGGPDVVVLSDALWRRHYGADPAVVGRAVHLDGMPYTVAAVMPPDFLNVTAPSAEVWSLLGYDAALPSSDGREWGHHLDMVGRLAPGVDLEAARADLYALGRAPVPEFVRPAWAAMEPGLLLEPLRHASTAAARPTMVALTLAALVLLAIACANVSILCLARTARRVGELEVRAALGAGRGRLARELVIEACLLAGAGCVAGLAIARGAAAGLAGLAPPELLATGAALDVSAFAFATALTALVGLAVGSAPALAVLRRRGHGGARRSSRRSVTARGPRALVATEVALAVSLLVGTALLVRSLDRLLHVPLGFDAGDAIVMQVHATSFEDDAEAARFYVDMLDAVRQINGVRAAAVTSQLPLSGDAQIYGVKLADGAPGPGLGGEAYRYAVTPGYFTTMGIDVVEGRALGPGDGAGAAPSVVLSSALARRLFPNGRVIGRRVHLGRGDLPPYTVVGVAADVQQPAIGAGDLEAAYVTHAQWYFADRVRWLVMRPSASPSEDLVAVARRAIWSVDPDQPIVRVDTLAGVVARSEARRRFVRTILQAFAIMAVLLAGVGLHGVLSADVAARVPELGIRSALGASRTSIVRLVVRGGMALTVAGVSVGLVVASLGTRFLASFLFGVTPLDSVSFAVAAGVVLLVAAVACSVPAARAARIDPLRALAFD